MKQYLKFLGILIFIALIINFLGFLKWKISSKNSKVISKYYKKLRQKALNITPKQLQLNMPEDSISVYGVVLDYNMGDVIATTVAFKTGDVSLYLSSGGGIIGGGQHENVSLEAIKFVELATNYISGTPVKKKRLPLNDCITVYLLTNKGTYLQRETMENFENNVSKLQPLLEESNQLLSKIRNVSNI